MTIVERLRRRSALDERTGCIVWNRPVGTLYYGRVSIGNQDYLAHRVAFETFVGPIPQGLCVLHKCDNPPCINPEHLFLGTKLDNTSDMDRKGRRGYGYGPTWKVNFKPRYGESNPLAKLTAVQAAAIRSDSRILRLIAHQYGVSTTTICLIKQGKRYHDI